jgi:hypothetical protein
MFKISGDTRRQVSDYWGSRNYLRWRVTDQLQLKRSDSAPLWAAEIAMYFEKEDWPSGLPQPARFRLVAGPREVSKEELPVFDLAAFKGLEADTVILVNGGRPRMSPEEIYVGISRARFALAVIDCGGGLDFPRELLDFSH